MKAEALALDGEEEDEPWSYSWLHLLWLFTYLRFSLHVSIYMWSYIKSSVEFLSCVVVVHFVNICRMYIYTSQVFSLQAQIFKHGWYGMIFY